jgi:hypothetical protein
MGAINLLNLLLVGVKSGKEPMHFCARISINYFEAGEEKNEHS